MEKTYNPKDFEKRIYDEWIKNDYFAGNKDSHKPKYSILMPPPNITGKLHIGHALNHTIPDIIARYKRLTGFEVEYVPGTDHAAIATEAKVVADLAKRGIKKEDLTRDEFEQEMQAWYKLYGGFILEQIKSLGISPDWAKQAFTRDDIRNKAVNEAFVELWQKGLIYRGERLTNWCPHCNTALSDIEVVYHDTQSKLYHIRYYLEGSDVDYLVVATTRPETLFGDLAVAVNPSDDRYTRFVGKKVILPILGKAIPVIADEYVDTTFGTGALKVTPSHDINDYNLGKKHNLGFCQVINKDGTLNELCGEFAGLKGLEARETVAKHLDSIGLLHKVEDYNNKVGCCERCHTPVESLISEQWFVSMRDIAAKTKVFMDAGEVRILPDSAKKRIYEWLNNIQDWCISRQLWSGHRIPVYTCNDCGEIFASIKGDKCPKCGKSHLTQDPDVLDTWFSSGLWPLSTLGWPEDTDEIKRYFPYDLVVTATDILTFWISRMLFMSVELYGKIPFHNVVATGLVVDKEGRKMSKNLGNGVDPDDVIAEFGADALRLGLVHGMSIEGNTKFDNSKLDLSRRFINKIWNASRFVEMNISSHATFPIANCELQLADKWILSELNNTIARVNKFFDDFEVGMALSEIYDFAWYKFCDYYIEFSKPNMQSDNINIVNTTASVLKYTLQAILTMLHPFIPFVTEEIYTNLFGSSILLSVWPSVEPSLNAPTECEQMLSIMELTRGIRNIRTEYKCDQKRELKAKLLVRGTTDNLQENIIYIQKLTNTKIAVVDTESNSKQDILISTPYYLLYLDGSELINVDAEKERLTRELQKVTDEANRLDNLLNNQGFLAKAPQKVVDKYRKDITDLRDKERNIRESIDKLS